MIFERCDEWAVLFLDPEEVIRLVLGPTQRFFASTADRLVGQSLSEIFPQEAVELLRSGLARARTGESPELAVRLEASGAAAIEVTILAGAVRGAPPLDALIVRAPCAMRALADETSLFARAPYGYLLLDALRDPAGRVTDFRILAMNEQAARIFEVDRQSAVGKTLTSALGNFEPAWRERLATAATEGSSLEWVAQSEALGGRWFSLAVAAGASGALLFHMQDITRTIEAEERLRESLERLDHVLAATPTILALLGVDPQTQRLYPKWVSPSIEHVLGYQPEEVLNEHDWWLVHLNPEDRDRVVAESSEILAKGEHWAEYRVRTKWGRDVWVREHARVVRVHDEQPVEVVVTWTDVTRRVLAEQLEKEHLATLAAERQIAMEAIQAETLEELSAVVARTCVETLGAKFAWLGRKEPDGGVSPVGHWPRDVDLLDKITVRWDHASFGLGPTGRCLATGEDAVCHDFRAEAALAPWHSLLEEYKLRSGYAVPLVVRGKVVGHMTVYSDKPGFFISWRSEFLRDIAPWVGAEFGSRLAFDLARQRIAHLEGLRRIDLQILENPRLDAIGQQLMAEIVTSLRVDAAALLEVPVDGRARYLAASGLERGVPQLVVLAGGIRDRILRERKRIVVEDLRHVPYEFAHAQLFTEMGYRWYCGQPILVQDELLGIVEVYHRRVLVPDAEWFALLETLVGQAAIGMELVRHIGALSERSQQLQAAYEATMQGWVRALEMRDKETKGHTQRVTQMTLALARASGIPEREWPHIERGALLHDVGKIGIPDSILHKPGPLTPQEWEIMKTHPTLAMQMLWPIEFLRPALDIPYCHHEKWDGTGYPRGLRGEDIPWPARIFAVVDVYDALNNDRPYRPAWPQEKTLAYLREGSGRHFDPRAVELFFDVIAKQ